MTADIIILLVKKKKSYKRLRGVTQYTIYEISKFLGQYLYASAFKEAILMSR